MPTPSAAERPLLTIPETAALLGLSRAVTYRLAALDHLPGLVRPPGCRLMVRRRVLEAWLAGEEVAGRPSGAPPVTPLPALGRPGLVVPVGPAGARGSRR